MTAIYKKEFRGFLNSMIGYVFIAFLLVVSGIYFTAYHLQAMYPKFSYTLQGVLFVFLILFLIFFNLFTFGLFIICLLFKNIFFSFFLVSTKIKFLFGIISLNLKISSLFILIFISAFFHIFILLFTILIS